MKKQIICIITLALIIMAASWAGAADIKMPIHFADITVDGSTGTTIDPSSGISLIAVIDVAWYSPRGYFSIAPDTITWGADTADPGGTGSVSGVSVALFYDVSKTKLTTAQWEAKGISGVTQIIEYDIDSGDTGEYVHFSPALNRYIGIFISGETQILTPTAKTAIQ